MFCSNCGKEVNESDKFCQNCGTSVENGVAPETVNAQYNQTNNNAGKTNPSAIAGFVCSLVGFLFAGIILGTISICLGVSAKKHIAIFKNEKGKGLATTAIVMGIIDLVGAILIVILNAILL